jgi:hypothetical protein
MEWLIDNLGVGPTGLFLVDGVSGPTADML